MKEFLICLLGICGAVNSIVVLQEEELPTANKIFYLISLIGIFVDCFFLAR